MNARVVAGYRVVLAEGADIEGFRRALRSLTARSVHPDDVVFETDRQSGFLAGFLGGAALENAPPVALPKKVAELIGLVVCHRDPERYALLYRLAWRVLNGERQLIEVASDPLVHRLDRMARTIRRDLHKMHAFLRFRRVEGEDHERFVAWFEPDHFILEATAQFFVDRFRSLDWTILTPIGSLRWDRRSLAFGPPARQQDAPAGDRFEEGWRDYYESIFNPARVNPKAMRAEMPKKYWRNMPEAASIAALIREAPERMALMIDREATMPVKRKPERALEALWDHEPKSLAELNAIIARAGPLVPGATQAVFGEGPAHAAIAFVGEQPGDQEDLQGRPFVGPAGQLLVRAMGEAGIARETVYLTNAVKHFKFEERGKRRIHAKPTAGEVKHYRPFLMKELDLVQPRMVVALGGTALLALAGKALPVTKARGPTTFENRPGYVTVHPSYLLRVPDPDAKREAYEKFVEDMVLVQDLARGAAA